MVRGEVECVLCTVGLLYGVCFGLCLNDNTDEGAKGFQAEGLKADGLGGVVHEIGVVRSETDVAVYGVSCKVAEFKWIRLLKESVDEEFKGEVDVGVHGF